MRRIGDIRIGILIVPDSFSLHPDNTFILLIQDHLQLGHPAHHGLQFLIQKSFNLSTSPVYLLCLLLLLRDEFVKLLICTNELSNTFLVLLFLSACLLGNRRPKLLDERILPFYCLVERMDLSFQLGYLRILYTAQLGLLDKLFFEGGELILHYCFLASKGGVCGFQLFSLLGLALVLYFLAF